MKSPFSRSAVARLQEILSDRPVIVFDYDGTLVPIIDDPTKSYLPARRKRLLRELANQVPCVILTGRGLKQMRPFLKGIPLKHLIGNHGLEKGGLVAGELKRFRKQTRAWKPLLQNAIAPFEGAWLEDKRLTLTVHYRLAPRKKDVVRSVMKLIGGTRPALRGASVMKGKQTINLLPSKNLHKGEAVLRLIERRHYRGVVYLGDDVTDEYVFKTVKRKNFFGIIVGNRRPTEAEYRMPFDQIDHFLNLVKRLTS